MRIATEIMWEILHKQPVAKEIDPNEILECMRVYAKEIIMECKDIMYDNDIDEAVAKMDNLINELV